MMQYGYQQYKTQSVETMTKGEMLILLYDEINKRLLRAGAYLEKEQLDLFEADIQRAIDIINYLAKSLDRKYPISAELYRLYDFMTVQLTRVKSGRNIKLAEEILPLVKELRESFKEADRITKKDPSVGDGIGSSTSSVTLGVG
ncbi:flagellar export chaperone FliS [Aminipila butyrica]|uniref:Flagellar export chaperone FliS n=1 Tax=Aminipila butyrica TaxID=433296 RepID=A0A858BSS4_9FIRM|nr:flagellar export chaperone FliS [Aminipila butyrica]QIB68412.1 flagellar export chaperone FliS [Aminipila butyrica]